MKKLFVCALFFALAHCKTGNQGNSAANKLRAEALEDLKKGLGGKYPSQIDLSNENLKVGIYLDYLKGFLGGFDHTSFNVQQKMKEGANTDERPVPGIDGKTFQYSDEDLNPVGVREPTEGGGYSIYTPNKEQYASIFNKLVSSNLGALQLYEDFLRKSKPLAKITSRGARQWMLPNHSDGSPSHAFLLACYNKTGDSGQEAMTLVVGSSLGIYFMEAIEEGDKAETMEFLKVFFGLDNYTPKSTPDAHWEKYREDLKTVGLRGLMEVVKMDQIFDVLRDEPGDALVLFGKFLMHWPVQKVDAVQDDDRADDDRAEDDRADAPRVEEVDADIDFDGFFELPEDWKD